MTIKVLQIIGFVALLGAVVIFSITDRNSLALVMACGALLVLLFSRSSILGNPEGISGLPDGVEPRDVKNYRREHPDASISDAIRALSN